MGLDMYLYKRTYVGNNWEKDPKKRVKVVVPKEKRTTSKLITSE